MGLCCCTKPNGELKQKGNNEQGNIISITANVDESICEIKSRSGLKGIGFFVKIPFPKNNKTINVLITSNKLINEYDLTDANNIKLYLKNNINNITIDSNIDNNRKFYTNNEYRITIIEILEKDELENIPFLTAVSNLDNQQMTPNTINYFESIFLLCYNANYDNSRKDQYITGNIVNSPYENDNRIFAFYTAINNNMAEAIGCPILLINEHKVIGINITEQIGSNNGILIDKPILDFYFKYSTKIKVIFQDIDLNKYYFIEAFDSFMFGELISSFYSQTNIPFDDKITFFFNNEEIPCYSTEILLFLNIENGSRIFLQRKLYLKGNRINVIFCFPNGNKRVVQALENNTTKELILKFFLSINQLYREAINKYGFHFNNREIIPGDQTLRNLTTYFNFSIIVIEKM